MGRRREYARLEKQGPSSRLSWLCECEWPELVSMYCNENIQTVPQSYFVVTSENQLEYLNGPHPSQTRSSVPFIEFIESIVDYLVFT